MARIVINTWGSYGDLNPYLGLAVALRARGHHPVLALPRIYGDAIRAAGVEFALVEPDADPELDPALVHKVLNARHGVQAIFEEILMPALPQAYATLLSAVQGADLLITHPAALAGPTVAEVTGIKWLSSVLTPMSFMSAHDPVLPPQASFLRHLPWRVHQRIAPWIADAGRVVSSRWVEPLQAFRATLGLSRLVNPLFEGMFSPRGVLAMYSRVFGGPHPDWPANVTVTGQVRYDATQGGHVLADEVQRFLDAGDPPVVFTLGSSAVMTADRFWDECVDASRRLGVRAVLLAGPVHAPRLQRTAGASVCAVAAAPHSQLFPRAAVVVQPCGIGTTGTALAAGKPQLAVPWANDQPDTAWRLTRMGLAHTITPSRFRAPRVARMLSALLSDTAMRARAAEVAAVVATESGADTACEAIEAALAVP
jgi:rhamnosyltransferase subunit B